MININYATPQQNTRMAKKLSAAAKNALIKDYSTKSYTPRSTVFNMSDKFISFMKLIKQDNPECYVRYARLMTDNINQIRKEYGKNGTTATIKKLVASKKTAINFGLALLKSSGENLSKYI